MGAAAVVALIAQGLQLATEGLAAAQSASVILKQAQDEGWKDDDPRWADAFKVADEMLKKAMDRL